MESYRVNGHVNRGHLDTLDYTPQHILDASTTFDPPASIGYDRFDAAANADGLEVRVVTDELPYAVVLFDEAGIGLFGYEDGILVGAIFSDDPDVMSWGECVFRRTLWRSEKI